MNQRAWQYLRDRLDKAIERHKARADGMILSYAWEKELKQRIAECERRLGRERRRKRRIQDSQRRRILERANPITEKMVLDDAPGALRLLRLFEKAKF